jgi:protein SCO1/2
MRRTLVIAAAAVAALALGAAPRALERNGLAAAATMQTGASLYNLDETWTSQEGARMPLRALAGKPVVAAMGYTTCKNICPAIVADMMWIEKHLTPTEAERVRFAFFSLDPAADTPERLKLYAEGHGLDAARWTLLTADDDAVRELAQALNIGYRPDGQGGFDHSAVISLIDAKGEIVFQQRGPEASSEELLGKLRALPSGTK